MLKERAELRKRPEAKIKKAEQFSKQVKSCCYCGKSDVKLTIDHIVPISRGGTNSLNNIALACGHCNSSKGNKTLDEWLNT